MFIKYLAKFLAVVLSQDPGTWHLFVACTISGFLCLRGLFHYASDSSTELYGIKTGPFYAHIMLSVAAQDSEWSSKAPVSLSIPAVYSAVICSAPSLRAVTTKIELGFM